VRISRKEWIQSRLEQNRPWTAYALADLEPGYYENAEWFCDPDGVGLTLLYHGFHRPLIFCIEHSSHLESVLDEIEGILDGPDRYLVSGPEDVPVLRRRYNVSEERKMIRMALDARSFRPAPGEVTRLGPDDLSNLKTLYTENPPEFFLDSMLTNGIYYGIYEGIELVAVAGTHIASHQYSVGGLGNIYTRAERRSQGYATRVTAAVTSELLALGVSTIVLNVREDNEAAGRVYSRLGYEPFCQYSELTVAQS
jgi:ribosomal protein S18 acetylase RimI-like enzyme